MTERQQKRYSISRLNEDQIGNLVNLLKSDFKPFLENGYWTWKHNQNPNFDPSLIAVAVADNQVIGCNHWILRDLKLSNEITVKVVLAAEVLVRPDFRGQGLGTKLLQYMREQRIFEEKGAVFSYMFTNGTLNKRLYEPALGYIPAPRQTATYKKFFNCKTIAEKTQDINGKVQRDSFLKKQMESLSLSATFGLVGAPPFTLNVEKGEITLKEGAAENADVVISGKIPFSYSVFDSNKGLWSWTKSLLVGQIKIKRGWLKLSKLLKVLTVMKQAIET